MKVVVCMLSTIQIKLSTIQININNELKTKTDQFFKNFGTDKYSIR